MTEWGATFLLFLIPFLLSHLCPISCHGEGTNPTEMNNSRIHKHSLKYSHNGLNFFVTPHLQKFTPRSKLGCFVSCLRMMVNILMSLNFCSTPSIRLLELTELKQSTKTLVNLGKVDIRAHPAVLREQIWCKRPDYPTIKLNPLHTRLYPE